VHSGSNDGKRLPVPGHELVAPAKATRANTDEQLLSSWLGSLASDLTRRNFEITARRFLAELPMGMRKATIEDVRDTLAKISVGKSEASTRQYVLRVKSLLGHAQRAGYTLFNAGATIKVRSDAANRGANLARRIIPEVDVKLLLRAAPSRRDRILLEVTYAGGLRVSEVVALAWADVLARDERAQLSITGKGGKVRQVLLPRWSAARCCRYVTRPAPMTQYSPAACRIRHGEARCSQGRHQRGRIAALAAACSRLARNRPRRHAAGGASHPGPCQRVDHEWLSARAA
jgi:site-specific recombinase XerD